MVERKVSSTAVCLCGCVLSSKGLRLARPLTNDAISWDCSLAIRSTVRFSEQDLTPDPTEEAKTILPLLPPLPRQPSGCAWKVLHEQTPSTLCRATAAGGHLCSLPRERDLSNRSYTRIPTGCTHPQDRYFHVARKHLHLKWWLSLLSLTPGGCMF